MIRWSARQVSEALDKVEAIVGPLLKPLEEAKAVVAEAKKIPNLPEYIKERLTGLESEIGRYLGGVTPWDNKPYSGTIYLDIERIRANIPKAELAKEQAEFQKMLTFFGGDREKTELALATFTPKPTAKNQMAMDISE